MSPEGGGAEEAGVVFTSGIHRNRTSPSQPQEAGQRPAHSHIPDLRIVLKKYIQKEKIYT